MCFPKYLSNFKNENLLSNFKKENILSNMNTMYINSDDGVGEQSTSIFFRPVFLLLIVQFDLTKN